MKDKTSASVLLNISAFICIAVVKGMKSFFSVALQDSRHTLAS